MAARVRADHRTCSSGILADDGVESWGYGLGREVGVVRPACKSLAKRPRGTFSWTGERTLLDELKSVDNVALVRRKEETTALDRLARRSLSRRDFGTKLDAAAKDAAVVSGRWGGEGFEGSSRVGLPGVSGKGASVLSVVCRCRVARNGIAEIVVTR